MSKDHLLSLAVLNIEAVLTARLNPDNIVSVYASSNCQQTAISLAVTLQIGSGMRVFSQTFRA